MHNLKKFCSINGNTNSTTGTYVDVLTASNGCDSTVTTNLTVLSSLSVTVSAIGNSTVCSGQTVSLSVQGWVPATSYQWSDANGPIAGATSSTYSASASGSYTLTITTSNGCTATSNAVTATIITPTTPTNLSATAIGLSNATINWDAVANANHYEVRFRASGGTWQIYNTPTVSMTRYGLTAANDYEWEVRTA